jgi:hypothetical protein
MAENQWTRQFQVRNDSLDQEYVNSNYGSNLVSQLCDRASAEDVDIGETFIAAPEPPFRRIVGYPSVTVTTPSQFNLEPEDFGKDVFRSPKNDSNCDTVSRTSSYARSLASQLEFYSPENMEPANYDLDCGLSNYEPSSDVAEKSATAAILPKEYRNGDLEVPNLDPDFGFVEIYDGGYGENLFQRDFVNFHDGSGAAQPFHLQQIDPTTKKQGLKGDRSRARTKRYLCDRCDKTTGRAGDLRRHYKIHLPAQFKYHCPVEGCNRNGCAGFYRRDKLCDHLRKAHPGWSQTLTFSSIA